MIDSGEARPVKFDKLKYISPRHILYLKLTFYAPNYLLHKAWTKSISEM